MRKKAVVSVIALLAFVAVGCSSSDGDGPTGPSPNAPVVSNFSIRALTPEKANTEISYMITATVQDLNGDLMGGSVEWREATQTLTLPIDNTVLQGTNLAVLLMTIPVPAGTYTASFVVIDAAGNAAIPIPITLNVTNFAAPRPSSTSQKVSPQPFGKHLQAR